MESGKLNKKSKPSITKTIIHFKKNELEWVRNIEIQIQHGSCGIRRRNFPVFKEIILKYLNEVSYIKNMTSRN